MQSGPLQRAKLLMYETCKKHFEVTGHQGGAEIKLQTLYGVSFPNSCIFGVYQCIIVPVSPQYYFKMLKCYNIYVFCTENYQLIAHLT